MISYAMKIIHENKNYAKYYVAERIHILVVALMKIETSVDLQKKEQNILQNVIKKNFKY